MTEQKWAGWGYLIIWEFQVRSGMEGRFEEAYGPNGKWTKLFAQDEAYIGTELIHNLKSARTYLTLDFWKSQAVYDQFCELHRAEYKAIDESYEEMTESERALGSFVKVSEKVVPR